MNIRVLTLDPGVTTGYAMGVVDTDSSVLTVATGQRNVNHKQLWEFLCSHAPDIVVTESFEYRQKSRKGLILLSVEFIGITTLWAELHYRKFVKQTASQGKGHFDDRKLKDLHLHKPGQDHANDAARHLLHWFEFGQGFQYNNRKGRVVAGAW